MPESRDPSRSSRVDWRGALLAVAGLGALVFALLEWPARGSGSAFEWVALAGGAASLVLLVSVERRVDSPMLPLQLFASRAFALTNLLTLFLYGAMGTILWLVPLLLIQVLHYPPTAAGAALLPLPVLMFALSRWSGGLVARVAPRWPLTVGPLIAAAGLAWSARIPTADSYWTGAFPAMTTLALGMTIVVAPLTTTVMTAVSAEHAGVASGVNNAVARVAALVAIAVFGIVLVRSFEARVAPALAALKLPEAARAAVERELPKLAGIPNARRRCGARSIRRLPAPSSS
jgi:predicted MFS family arabinose efflux permease